MRSGAVPDTVGSMIEVDHREDARMDSVADDLAIILPAGLEDLVAILHPWDWTSSNASEKEKSCKESRAKRSSKDTATEKCNEKNRMLATR